MNLNRLSHFAAVVDTRSFTQAAGRLVHVLPDWELPAGGIHAVFPAARFRPAKVTAFLDLLVAANKRKAPPLRPA